MSYAKCTIEADILIIGGGSAGSMAAITAKGMNPAQRVVVFEKGDVKYSGSIPRGMDALNIVAVPGISSPEEYLEATQLACDGIVDDPPSYAMASRSWELSQQLESWGVYFPKDAEGNYEVLKVHPKGRFCMVMNEPELKTMLFRRMHDLGCVLVSRTMALDLLEEDGRVVGAVGLNVRSGGLVECRAKAVILCCGGAARFGLPGNGHLYGIYDFPGNTGDGYTMAYRAGASLTGFEYTVNFYIIKDINAPMLFITSTRGAKLFNAVDKEIDAAHIAVKSMHGEHSRGFGPVRVKMQHLPEEKIQEIEDILFTTERPVQKRFFEGRGVNFRTSDVELGPTEYLLCGGHGITGIVVNDRGETSVPGLYAAGDVACVARGHLSGAFTFGQICAENATRYARSQPGCTRELPGVSLAIRKVTGIESWRGQISIEEFEFKTRRLINDYVVPPKNAYKLSQAQRWMQRLREELRCQVHIGNTHDLFKALEVENIITCAHLSAVASEARKESRWGTWHYRSDYPERNDADWMRHVVLKQGECEADVRVSTRPVERMKTA